MALPVFYVFDICFNRFLQKLAAALGIDSEDSGSWLELKQPHAFTSRMTRCPRCLSGAKGNTMTKTFTHTHKAQAVSHSQGWKKIAGKLYS